VVFTEMQDQNSFQLEAMQTNYNFSPGSYFVKLTFEMDTIQGTYVRKYMKLQDVFAQVGGLLQFIKLAAVIMYLNFSRMLYFENIYNKFYSFNVKNACSEDIKLKNLVNQSFQKRDVSSADIIEKKSNFSEAKKENESGNMLKLDFSERQSDFGTKKNNRDNHPSYHRQDDDQEGLHFSFLQSIFCANFIECCYDKKERLRINNFNQVSEVIKEQLNVTTILKLVKEIELIKFLLLTKDQLLVVESISSLKLDISKEVKNYNLRSYLLKKEKILDIPKSEFEAIIERLAKENKPISDKVAQSYIEL